MPDNAAPILIVTRPAAASARFCHGLGPALGEVEVIVSPVMEIVPLVPGIPSDAPGDLILTSENGAAAAARFGFQGRVAWVVGARTAEIARASGVIAREPARDADDLVQRIRAAGDPGPFLHLRGAHARGDIAARLRSAGQAVEEMVVYEQRACALTEAALDALGGNRPIVLPVFSPRSGAIISAQGPFAAPVHIVAISPAAAAELESLAPVSVRIAAEPDGAAMIAATIAAIGAARAG